LFGAMVEAILGTKFETNGDIICVVRT
jgi:hypothetical protein